MVVGSCRIGSKNSRVVAVTRTNPGSRSSTPSYDGLLALSLSLSSIGQVTVAVALSVVSSTNRCPNSP